MLLSIFVPPYNPRDIVENLRRRINGNSRSDMRPMESWYRNWTGHSERLDTNHFILSGNIQENSRSIFPTPPPRSRAAHKMHSPTAYILKSHSKDKQMNAAAQKSLEEELGLHHIMTTENPIALDADGQIQQHHTEFDILEEFYLLRCQVYQTRKQYLLITMQKELTRWTDQFRFANVILNGELDISQDETSLADRLHQLGFALDGNTTTNKRKRNASEVDIALAGYEYLFNMTVSSKMRKYLDELESQIASKRAGMVKIGETTLGGMWEADLREFLLEWEIHLQ
ncbi:type II DNA topoisomerase [Aureobasidium pullulans]|nr:type II DNA topoisomerase [Aureobasidium pullulans]